MTQPQPRTAPRQLLTAAAPFVLGAAAVWGALGLGIGSLTDPGPGLWPLLVGIAMMLGSAAMMLTGSEGEPFTRRSWYVLAGAVALGVFVGLFQTVGFVLPSLLVLLVWLRWISKESWVVSVAVTVIATAVLYVLFDVLLGVPFPFDIVTGR